VGNIIAVTSDLIEADGAEEAPRVAWRPARDALTRPLPDELLPKSPPDIAQQVALEYRRVYLARVTRVEQSDCERAAIDAAIRKYQELDPAAPFNRHDAVAATLEMVGKVILADHLWFWHGGSGTGPTPDAATAASLFESASIGANAPCEPERA
jgi:hypothetical protein